MGRRIKVTWKTWVLETHSRVLEEDEFDQLPEVGHKVLAGHVPLDGEDGDLLDFASTYESMPQHAEVESREIAALEYIE